MLANLKIYESQKSEIHKDKDISEDRIYYMKQKLSGLALVGIGILCPFISDGDATASLVIIPIGVYLIFTKQKVMNFKR